jgi:hypothetical protein
VVGFVQEPFTTTALGLNVAVTVQLLVTAPVVKVTAEVDGPVGPPPQVSEEIDCIS